MNDPQPAPETPASGTPPVQTGTLSISTEPSPLAVMVYDHQLNTVAQGVSPAQIKLPPGVYMVRAAMVGRPDPMQVARVVANSDRKLRLSANESAPASGTSSSLTGILDKYVRKLDPPPPPLTPTHSAAPPRANTQPFWLRFFRLRDWGHAERIEIVPSSTAYERGKAVLELKHWRQGALFAQVACPDMRIVNVAIPPAGALAPVRCYLVVATRLERLEAHVRLSTAWANSALQYLSQGHFEEAKQLVAEGARPAYAAESTIQKFLHRFEKPGPPSRIIRVVQRMVDRFEDPTVTLVPRYVGLRTGEATVFNTFGTFLLDLAQGLPDGLVISAEIAAYERRYRLAAERILAIPAGGLPFFTEGFSLLMHRVRELIDLDPKKSPPDQHPTNEQIERLKDLRRTLSKWAPFLDLNSPTITFRGNDVTAPSENEKPIAPGPDDGWIKAGAEPPKAKA